MKRIIVPVLVLTAIVGNVLQAGTCRSCTLRKRPVNRQCTSCTVKRTNQVSTKKACANGMCKLATRTK